MYRASIPTYLATTGDDFESYENFAKASSQVNSAAGKLRSCGTVMGVSETKNCYLTTREELHTFVIGESGCGKTRRVIYPTIRLMSKTGESMVMSDPKGELYRTTSEYLRNKGYDVKAINFREPLTGDRYNPLEDIDILYHSGSETDREESLLRLKDMLKGMTESVHSEKDTYWENGALAFLRGVAMMIMEYCGKGNLTFGNISRISREMFKLKLEMINTRTDVSIKKKWGLLSDFMDSIPESSPIKEAISTVYLLDSRTTLSCFQSVVSTMLAPFTEQSAIIDAMSGSDIKLEQLGQKPTALYIILPDDSESLYDIATLYISQIYSSLISLADGEKDGRLPNKVNFLLDEFANFTKISDMASMLTASRSRGIRFTIVCQSMEQLVQKYGKEGAEIIMANCRVWIYMNCRNLPFLERLVALCGVRDIGIGKEPLVTVSKLQHLQMGEVLVLNDRCYPFMGYLPDYSEYDFNEPKAAEAKPKERKERGGKNTISLYDLIEAYNESRLDTAFASLNESVFY